MDIVLRAGKTYRLSGFHITFEVGKVVSVPEAIGNALLKERGADGSSVFEVSQPDAPVKTTRKIHLGRKTGGA